MNVRPEHGTNRGSTEHIQALSEQRTPSVSTRKHLTNKTFIRIVIATVILVGLNSLDCLPDLARNRRDIWLTNVRSSRLLRPATSRFAHRSMRAARSAGIRSVFAIVPAGESG
jgi:hypothetical protein